MTRDEALKNAIAELHKTAMTNEYKSVCALRSIAWSAIAALYPPPYINTGPK